MNFKNFLSFERMITPIIIKILFYIGLIGSLLGGLRVFLYDRCSGIGYRRFWANLVGIYSGRCAWWCADRFSWVPLPTRIYAELLILVFQDQRDHDRYQDPAAGETIRRVGNWASR
jgi:hypothetical protein